jgi:hypothetical protein
VQQHYTVGAQRIFCARVSSHDQQEKGSRFSASHVNHIILRSVLFYMQQSNVTHKKVLFKKQGTLV